jgi:hypothetical protein
MTAGFPVPTPDSSSDSATGSITDPTYAEHGTLTANTVKTVTVTGNPQTVIVRVRGGTDQREPLSEPVYRPRW